jgi:hypothetical protein
LNLKGSLGCISLAILLLVTAVMQGAPITGLANIAGEMSFSSSGIAFTPSFISTAGATQTGSFAELLGGNITSLPDLSTGDLYVPGFVSFTEGVTQPVTFDLTYISPGVGSAIACESSDIGSVCTPNRSALTFVQLASSTVLATIQVNGIAYSRSSEDSANPATGVFFATAVGTLPEVTTQVSIGQLSGVPYSASFVASPAPEPQAMFLMGIGLVCAGALARRSVFAR